MRRKCDQLGTFHHLMLFTSLTHSLDTFSPRTPEPGQGQ